MPTLKIHGVPAKKVQEFAGQMSKDLSLVFETEEDNITIEVIESTFFRFGKVDEKPYPMVDVVAFKRTEIMENQAAQVITDILRDFGFEYSEVIYHHPELEDYYCDGIASI